MWTTFHLGPYQPLSWMSYGVDYLLWGMKPFGYHLTAILLHALSAVLFAALAAQLFVLGSRSDPGRRPAREAWTAAAFGVFASLVWSLHPLRVEAVSWATERREVLCGVFTLAALLSHAAGRRILVTALAAVAAVLSKGTAVVIPVLLVLVDLHREAPAHLREWPSVVGRSVRRVAPLFALSAVVGVVAVVGQKQAEAVAGLERLGLLDRFALLGHGLGFYGLKTLVPVRLAPIYEMSSDLSEVRIGAAASVLLLIAAAGVAIARYPRLRSLLLLLAAYVVLVAPVGGLLQVGTQVAADSHLVLARALAAHGDAAGAAAAYERAMAAPTDSPAIAPMELAWLLATNPDPRARDGARAVTLARRAVELGRALEAQGGLALRSGLSWRLPRTLAAAQAESGDYDGASATLRESASLFPPEHKAEIDAWLAAFTRREPVRAEPGFP